MANMEGALWDLSVVAREINGKAMELGHWCGGNCELWVQVMNLLFITWPYILLRVSRFSAVCCFHSASMIFATWFTSL